MKNIKKDNREIKEMTQHEIDIFNEGMSLGWKLSWERIRELLNPIYRNTREKLPIYKINKNDRKTNKS
jgi:hypothetical protein